MYEAKPGTVLETTYNITLNGKPMEHVAYARPGETDGIVGLYEVDYPKSRDAGSLWFVMTPTHEMSVIEVKGVVTVEAKPTESIDLPETVCRSSMEVSGFIYHEYDIAQKLTLEFDRVDTITGISLYKIVSDSNGRWSGTWFFRDMRYVPNPLGELVVIISMKSVDGSGAGCNIAHLNLIEPSMDYDMTLPINRCSYTFHTRAPGFNDVGAKSICMILQTIIP